MSDEEEYFILTKQDILHLFWAIRKFIVADSFEVIEEAARLNGTNKRDRNVEVSSSEWPIYSPSNKPDVVVESSKLLTVNEARDIKDFLTAAFEQEKTNIGMIDNWIINFSERFEK